MGVYVSSFGFPYTEPIAFPAEIPRVQFESYIYSHVAKVLSVPIGFFMK